MIWNFYIQTKHKPHLSIYHAKFGKYTKFHKNPLQTRENMGPQTFTKKSMLGGNPYEIVLSP